jgi:acetyl-CoA carboxylase biotin carboxyl carrier protein
MPNKPSKPTPAVEHASVDIKELSKLATWLESTGLEEMEVETLEYRVRLKKPSMAMACPPAPMPQPVNLTVNPAPAAATAAPADDHANAFKSPMVGTFYQAAKPDAPAFVKEGDKVTAGQVLGIIEAMKTMNQIESDRAGTVTKVLVKNAQPVEFGQPLFIIA